MKTLIGLGCSHTQGSAYVKNFNRLDELGERTHIIPKLEFKNDKIKKLYNDTHTTHEWITENISWIGKLNKHLKYDKLLNFGMGGIGIEANIRTIRNYIFKVGDLSNHLIIHQLPHFDRSEFLLKVKGFTIYGVKKFLSDERSFNLDETSNSSINTSKNNLKSKLEKISNLVKEIKKLG